MTAGTKRVLIVVRHRHERSWWLESFPSSTCTCTPSHHLFRYKTKSSVKECCVWTVDPTGFAHMEVCESKHGPFEHIIIFGYAGACIPHLKKGDFLFPTLIFSEDSWLWDTWSLIPPHLPHELVRKRIWFGPHLTVKTPLRTRREKTLWYKRTFAWTVDMESWFYLGYIRKKMHSSGWKKRVTLFRIVLDTYDERVRFSKDRLLSRHRHSFESRKDVFLRVLHILMNP